MKTEKTIKTNGASQVMAVRIPTELYEQLRLMAQAQEGTIGQQVRIAIRERLERAKLLKRPCVARAAAQ